MRKVFVVGFYNGIVGVESHFRAFHRADFVHVKSLTVKTCARLFDNRAARAVQCDQKQYNGQGNKQNYYPQQRRYTVNHTLYKKIRQKFPLWHNQDFNILRQICKRVNIKVVFIALSAVIL
jgi:hypothetical protein